MRSPKCPNCSAPVREEDVNCAFCGAPLAADNLPAGPTTARKDFGFSGRRLWAVLFIGIIAIYSFGWYKEDKRFFLGTEAVLIWSAALPLWTIVLTALWRIRGGALLAGFIASVLLFAAHTLVSAGYAHWNFNDDYFGIAGIFSGIHFVSWLLGRGLHVWIRHYLNA